MNSIMTIQINVVGRQAIAQLNAVGGAVAGVGQKAQTSGKNATSFLGFLDEMAGSRLNKIAKNLSYVGRQLTYNFTIPFTLAAVALTKANLGIERSMTQVIKVYGDFSYTQARVDEETKALAKTFEMLSTRFGVLQEDVIDIAAGFASAGSAGVGLAKNTKAALEAMILGELDAATATEQLIAIQAQWQLSTIENKDGVSELEAALAKLNIIENQTGITFAGLLEVFSRASGVWRNAGGSIAELGAAAAALVPATGGAAQAGNALKTMVSRLIAPTSETLEILQLMGVELRSWQSMTITEKLEEMADSFSKLDSAQKNLVSSTVASRWQVNRFNILMDDIASGTGYYAKALDATSDDVRNIAQYHKELNTVLQSNPKKWDIMTQAIRNTAADAFAPLIPVLMEVMGIFVQLVTAFGKLDPEVRKWLIIGAMFIALVGPILQVISALLQLAHFTNVVAKMLAKAITMVIVPAINLMVDAMIAAVSGIAAAIGAPVWAVVAVIAAVVAAVILILKTDLEDRIWDIMKSIANAVSQLPRIFAESLKGVLRVIESVMQSIVDALSYLNPFARHSPSLVDNVTAGVSTILDQYAKFAAIPGLLRTATSALKDFGAAASPTGKTMREQGLRQYQTEISQNAGPEAGAAAGGVVDSIIALEAILPGLTAEIARQAQVVQTWQNAFDKASATLEEAQRRLAATQKAFDAVSDQIAAAQAEIDRLSEVPLAGMGAMEDQIFANEMAQNKLNLALLEYEKAGLSIDKIREKYNALNGDLENLRGERETLRLAGAGSDILKTYDDQIAAIQEQQSGLQDTEKAIVDIQKQLDALDLEKRWLELTKAITFDPQLREIDKLAHGVAELPFDEVVRQIKEQQQIIKDLQPEYDRLKQKVEEETAEVERATLVRDRIATQLDHEKEQLDALEEGYRSIVDLIGEMEGALTGFSDKLAAAAAEQSRLEELFAMGGDYDIPAGSGVLKPEGDIFDIEAFNRELQKELEGLYASFGNITLPDIFKPFRDAFDGFISFIKEWGKKIGIALLLAATSPFWLTAAAIYLFFKKFGPMIWNWTYKHVVEPVKNALVAGFGPVWQVISDTLKAVIDFLGPYISGFLGAVVTAWNTSYEAIKEILGFLVDVVKGAWDKIYFVIAPVWALIKVIFDEIGWFITELLVPWWKFLWEMVSKYVGFMWEVVQLWWDIVQNVFDKFIGYLKNYLFPIYELWWTIVQIVLVLIGKAFMFLWEHAVKPAMEGIWSIIQLVWYTFILPVFEAIKWVLENIVGPVFFWLRDNVIAPVWGALPGIIQTAWDLIKGVFDAIKNFVTGTFGSVWDWLYKVIAGVWNAIYKVIARVWNAIAAVIEGGINFLISAFNTIASIVNSIAGFLGIDASITKMEKISITRMNTDQSLGGDWAGLPGFGTGGGGGGSSGGTLHMAKGGIVPVQGDVVAGARAIVGEGSKSWPEYVVPTDPRYRGRAKNLFAELGPQIGMMSAQQKKRNEIGGGWGPLGWAADKGKGLISGAANLAESGLRWAADKMVETMWKPAEALARGAVNQIPMPFLKSVGHGMIDTVGEWVGGVAEGSGDKLDNLVKALVPTNGAGSWRVIPKMLDLKGIPYKILSTMREGAITRNTGQVSWHSMDRAIDLAGPTWLNHPQMLKIANAIRESFGPRLHELIYGGPGAQNIFNGKPHIFSNALLDEHVNHVHASLARGGMVIPRRTGGTLLRVGEGRADERVQVLPLSGKNEEGRVINFYGDLSFPNITKPSDAERFLANLESLSGRN